MPHRSRVVRAPVGPLLAFAASCVILPRDHREGEFLLAVGVVAVLVTTGFAVPYLIIEGVPEWVRLPRSKKKYRRELLEFIEWRRAKSLNEHGVLYPTEAEWNEKNLAEWVRRYSNHPSMYRQDMLDDRGETELMQWVLKNDPSVLQSRIQQLEKELEIKSE